MLASASNTGELFAIKQTQREIRAKEASYRDLDRLISALDRRFDGAAAGRRRYALTLTNSLRAHRSTSKGT
jgi:hypothetical protein